MKTKFTQIVSRQFAAAQCFKRYEKFAVNYHVRRKVTWCHLTKNPNINPRNDRLWDFEEKKLFILHIFIFTTILFLILICPAEEERKLLDLQICPL